MVLIDVRRIFRKRAKVPCETVQLHGIALRVVVHRPWGQSFVVKDRVGYTESVAARVKFNAPCDDARRMWRSL